MNLIKYRKIMQKKPGYRQRVNRYRFTINNPFITEQVKVLTLDTMDDEQKELYEHSRDRNDFNHLREFPYFDFAIVEYSQKEFADIFTKVVSERIFFKSYEAAQAYFQKIDFIDYVCFQYECGALGTRHLQGFMHFNRQMDFTVVKEIFPTIHLDKCYEANSYYINYCRKPETKIEGFDFFSHGVVPADERTRTDMNEFTADVLSNMSKIELFKKYPHLTLNAYNKIAQIQQDAIYEKYKNTIRDVWVTYIYGKEDAGKTTYCERVLGYEPFQTSIVGEYNTTGMFDEYQYQDVIIFDEFDSQLDITKMNKYLDGRPCSLPARNHNKVACYTKVFIISNYPLEYQYRKAIADGKEPSYKGFCRRIKEIIYMPERDVYIWQKGEPTEQVIKVLTEQGATYKIEVRYE